MSRLRRFNRKILGLSSAYTHESDTDQNEVSILPLDTEEQEELIQKFEVNAHVTNKLYINVLSVLYLLYGGLLMIFVRKAQGHIKLALLAGANSLICSCITLRYDIINDYFLFKTFKLRVSNFSINILNVVLLVFMSWISFNHVMEDKKTLFCLQVPMILFWVAVVVKRWARNMEDEIADLRRLKYKYKNA
ncbi:YGR016W [Saccharomyces arboricola H-6]|uniref:YGR016W n=1 Tax=Saccharomyces arboricola (strain H-6 / AS 2.3317 / CBS 10644) TaxID=1160507 RepID=J8PNL7_SACAR|nr:YGR016W [Saccharomyces arboricola H-6]